jgi:hypothetical protein
MYKYLHLLIINIKFSFHIDYISVYIYVMLHAILFGNAILNFFQSSLKIVLCYFM